MLSKPNIDTHMSRDTLRGGSSDSSASCSQVISVWKMLEVSRYAENWVFRPQCITYWSPTWVSDICQRLMITCDHNMNCIRQWQTPPWYETPCINSHVISKMTWADRSDWEILAVLGWTCYTRVLVCVMFGSHITSVVISGPFKLMDFGCDGSIGFHIMRWVS